MEEPTGRAAAGNDPVAGVNGPLEWVFRPWRDEPRMAWGACAGLGICALALGYVALPWLLKGALWLFAALALEPALIPSRFRADERGVERSTLLGKTRLAWESARRWRRHRLGVELGSGRREWLPGTGRKLRLFIPARERGRVLAALERERARHGG